MFSPDIPTVGASGALFGLLGALVVVAHYRGISIWQSGLGPTLLINVVFSLTVAGISIGGHLGGFVGGVICGVLYMELVDRRRLQPLFLIACVIVAAASVVAAIAVAGSTGISPNGLTI
jgi:membrane associated rhomboid family serine protease